MNGRLLDIGSSLADWENAELYLVAACCMPGAIFQSVADSAEFDLQVVESRRRGRMSLDEMVEEFAEPIPEERLAYRDGEAESVIVEFAQEIDADVIVMGTLTQNSVEGLLMGNTASEVLQRVRRSVLTVGANRK